MTDPAPSVAPRREVSSNRLFRTTLVWSAIAMAALAVVGGGIGYAVSGTSGLWSALVAVVLALVFLGFTAASILIANRWYGDPLYVPIFFGAVMGGWIVKFALFIIVLLVLRGAPWLNGMVFFIALVVSVLVSLAIDALVMLKMRVPNVSDVSLPTLADVIEEARAGGPAKEGNDQNPGAPTNESGPRA